MKVLLLLKDELKVNTRTSVLCSEDNCDYDLAFSTKPQHLEKAVREVLGKGKITEVTVCGNIATERKFRKTFANTIAYLENQLNLDKEGLPQPKKPEKKTFEISEKDRVRLGKKDVTKLEIAYAKFKPKAKKLLFDVGARWRYLRDKTVFKKKIPVYQGEGGYCFRVLDIKFLATDNLQNVDALEDFLSEKLKENDEFLVKEYDSRSKKLIANRVPLRTDDSREVVRKIVQSVAVVVFVVALSYLLYNSVYKSAENTAIQSEIQSIYYDGDTSKEISQEEKIKNFKKLKNINSEIVGWITVPHTNIDYPVLFHKDDTLNSQYYLYKNYEKNYSEYGSIFVDFRSQQGMKSKNVVMHGHHMMDGSMFSNLLKYGKTSIDMDFYKKSPTFTVSTPEGESVYKIISVYKTTGDKDASDFFNYIQGDFSSDAEFMNYVYNVRARSMVDCPVDVNEKDSLVTLSTCSYEVHSNYRTVVVGRKVRNGESEKVAVSKAKKNPHPYFPSDFYYRYGGTQPKLTSFKTELKKGNIDWYDGGGNLKGSQKLTGGKFVKDKTKTSTTKKTEPTTTTKPKTYTVKFLDSKGKVISTQKVEKGENAKAPKAPQKASTKYYRFTFVKWNRSYKNVEKNLVIKPVYRSTRIVQPTKQKETTTKTTTPKVTKPKATTPQTTKPKATAPKATTPKVTKPTKPTVKPTVKPTKPTTKPTTEPTTEAPTEPTVTEQEIEEVQDEV